MAKANFTVDATSERGFVLLEDLGTGMTIEAAIAKTFADYGLDYQGIVQEWQAQAQNEYGVR